MGKFNKTGETESEYEGSVCQAEKWGGEATGEM